MSHTRNQPIITRITPRVTWADLRLPPPRMQVLHDIAILLQQIRTSRGDPKFPATPSRAAGISVLFAGESGTVKEMAAEAIACELGLPLFRIDLSQVVSKYIGETEKNLRKVFEAAEDGGAILLFDEADALFGKRGEVKDSHDRYAGIELEYLFGGMEKFRGLSVLSTALQDSCDPAFVCRFRFVIRFPAPRQAEDQQGKGQITRPHKKPPVIRKTRYPNAASAGSDP